MILGELEHLKSLIKLARWKKNSKTTNNQISMVSTSLAIRKIYINNTLWNKTLHLFIDINNCG